jgi:hypothetical protein
MLTLLKQARAFGLGVVLATQNPVDVDYKALSNAGTWFLGRLQTERDKARVMDGLEGASLAAGRAFDRARLESILSRLGNRVFLMNDVHEDEPVVFETRWAMSYLRGPLTREQLRRLGAQPAAAPAPAPVASAAPAPAPVAAPAPRLGGTLLDAPPSPPPGVEAAFLAPQAAPGDASRLVYRPAVLVSAELHYVLAAAEVDAWVRVAGLAPLPEGGEIDWSAGWQPEQAPALDAAPRPGAKFEPLPATALGGAKAFKGWAASFGAWCQRAEARTLWSCPRFKAYARVGEGKAAFQARMQQRAREERDLEVEKLRRKYEPRLQRLQAKVAEAEGRLARERAQAGQAQMNAALDLGGTVLGAFFGRRAGVRTGQHIARAGARAAKEQQDAEHAAVAVEQVRAELAQLDAAFRAEADALALAAPALEPVVLAPRKSDTRTDRVALAWIPWRVAPDGTREPLAPLPPMPPPP